MRRSSRIARPCSASSTRRGSRGRRADAPLTAARPSAHQHEKAQPRLPIEIQLSIARQAGLVLYAAGTSAERQQMTQLCLVSPGWKNVIQGIMYHTAGILNGAHRKLPLYILPSSVGQHIRQIDLGNHPSESEAIIKRLRLLPALNSIKGLYWTDAVADVEPPAYSARPALVSLSLGKATASAAAQLERFFDLSPLQRFGLECADYNPKLLAVVPVGIRALKIWDVCFSKVATVTNALARFINLTSLTFVMFSDSEALAIRLPTFPRLVELTVSLTGTPHALETAQPALRQLVLSDLDPESHPTPAQIIVQHVRKVCRIITTTSAGSFPALRSIAITSTFSTHVFLYNPRRLPHADLSGLSQALSAAGLHFVDKEGNEWKEEWEQGAGQA